MMRSFLVAALASTLLLGGCGLISSDITNFDLALPDKTFTVDAKNWSLQGAETLIDTHCDPPPASDICAQAALAGCAEGTCIGQCNATTTTCDLTLFIGLYTSVNLREEKPELENIQDEPIIDVTIDDITYEVVENTFNVDTPELKVYAGPEAAMRPGDPAAREIGTVPPILAGQTRTSSKVMLSASGRANLAMFMGDFKTTFNIIVGSNLLVQTGDQVPTGRLVVKVSVKAHAGV